MMLRGTPKPIISHDADLFCVGCGYNLRGIGAERGCPECGTGVSATIEQIGRDGLSGKSGVVRLRNLLRYEAATLVGLFASVVIRPGAQLYARGFNDSPLQYTLTTFGDSLLSLVFLVMAVGLARQIAGMWLLPSPGTTRLCTDRAHRAAVFLLVLFGLVLALNVAVFFFGLSTPRVGWGRTAVDALVQVVRLEARVFEPMILAAVVFSICGLISHVIAAQQRREEAARLIRLRRWLAASFLICAAIAIFTLILDVVPGVSWSLFPNVRASSYWSVLLSPLLPITIAFAASMIAVLSGNLKPTPVSGEIPVLELRDARRIGTATAVLSAGLAVGQLKDATFFALHSDSQTALSLSCVWNAFSAIAGLVVLTFFVVDFVLARRLEAAPSRRWRDVSTLMSIQARFVFVFFAAGIGVGLSIDPNLRRSLAYCVALIALWALWLMFRVLRLVRLGLSIEFSARSSRAGSILVLLIGSMLTIQFCYWRDTGRVPLLYPGSGSDLRDKVFDVVIALLVATTAVALFVDSLRVRRMAMMWRMLSGATATS